MDKELFTTTERAILFNGDCRFALNPKDNSPGTLTGYAMIWGALSEDRGGYKVRLLPKSATFANPTYALFNHNWSAMLGFTEDNSLRLNVDEIGVRFEMDLIDTQGGYDVAKYVSRKMIKGMSFALLPGGKYNYTTENGVKVQNYEAFVSDEVTVTPIPAFDATTVEIADTNNGVSNGAVTVPNETTKIKRHSIKELDAELAKLDLARLDLLKL